MSHLHPSPLESRPSYILPTVKCSNCAQPVPLSTLGDHVCPPQRAPQSSESRMRKDTNTHSPLGIGPTIVSSDSPQTSQVPFPSLTPRYPWPEEYTPGGESGMAGVGRRAFQAAAQAAVLAQHHARSDQPQGASFRRGNAPQLLDILAGRGELSDTDLPAVSNHLIGTPPLSPNSTHSHSSSRSYSPHTPRSQSPLTSTPAIPASPPLSSMSTSRAYSIPTQYSSNNATGASTATSRLPFFQQRYKNMVDQTPPVSPKDPDPFYTPRAESPRAPSPTDSESSIGLAYNREEEEEPVGLLGRLSLEDEKDRNSKYSHSAYSVGSKIRDDLASQSPRRSHTTPTAGPRGGAGGKPSPIGPSSPPGVPAARSVSDAKQARRDKDNKTTQRRVCVRCERSITDGRWVRADTNKGVLCERCWKNMYLPKCRRCDKPIENAAVFSSDGQLKGKYHRACFTCHVCQQPFPDKSFYVYDGHPLCAFHYHEANRSLCAWRTCGKPVEGPCAVTEAGDRFHPGCLRCEHVGCGERLEDYWEVDGMKLCERHAQGENEEEEEEEGGSPGQLGHVPSVRRLPKSGSGDAYAPAQKRTTRLINLSGGAF